MGEFHLKAFGNFFLSEIFLKEGVWYQFSFKERIKMEIKKLDFMKDLSENGNSENSNQASVMDSIIGGHGYGHSYQYVHSYRFHGHFPHPYFVKGVGVEVPEPKFTIGVDGATAGPPVDGGGTKFPYW